MKSLWRETLKVRAWSFVNVFFLFLAAPKVVELSEERCVIRIPLNRRTRRRDIHAMYLGTLCMGADVAAGLIAFYTVRKRGLDISFIFKDIAGQFLKRADGDVVFTNTSGAAIQDMIRRAMESGEREETTVNVVATVPKKYGDEPVATFALTLSIKKRS